MDARMDGTVEEQLLWRVKALREALGEVCGMTAVDYPPHQTAKNALLVDEFNAEVMTGLTAAR